MSTQKNIRVRVPPTKANQFTGEMKFKNGIKINFDDGVWKVNGNGLAFEEVCKCVDILEEQLRKLKYRTDLYKEYKATVNYHEAKDFVASRKLKA